MSDILNPFEGVEIDRVFLSRAELSEPWSIQMPSMPNILLFHLVVEGSASIRFTKEKESHKISQGELSLIPHGEAHEFFDGTSKSTTPLLTFIERKLQITTRLSDTGGTVQVPNLCGA